MQYNMLIFTMAGTSNTLSCRYSNILLNIVTRITNMIKYYIINQFFLLLFKILIIYAHNTLVMFSGDYP